MRALAALLALLPVLPALAETPKAKSVTKEGDYDAVTLESGAFAKVYVPKSAQPGTKRGLVVTLHGAGGEETQMLSYGRELAEHRGDVWCAPRGSVQAGPGFTWNSGVDDKRVPEMTRYVIAGYDIDPKRVIVHGFSAGGAASCFIVPKNKDLYAGFVPCAAPDVPGGRGGDAKGVRAVTFLGKTDPNYSLAPEAERTIERYKPNACFWEVEELGHQLPDIVYLNDAFNFILDATQKGDKRTLPLKPDHAMAEAKGKTPPPPDYHHVLIAWKSAKSPAGVTRNKLQAKSVADNLLAKLRKKEVTLEQALEQSDDAETKAAGGAIDFAAIEKYGKKLADKARGMKVEAWEMVEGESGYHLLERAKAP